MPTLKTKLSDESSIHGSLRRALDHKWNGRKAGLDWRLMGTTSFGYGRGLSWVWLRKFNDTYVIGGRTHHAPAEHYPNKPVHSVNQYNNEQYILIQDKYKWDGEIKPMHLFWSPKPWVVCKPDKTYFPAMVDISRNNQLWGMGLYRYQMHNYGNVMRYNLREKFGAAFIGNTYIQDDTTLITGGICANDDGVYSYGSVVPRPTSQIYDKGIYNRGQRAFRAFRNVMEVYVQRHKILEPGWWGADYENEFLWSIVNRFDKMGYEGLSPTWILDTHLRANKERIDKASQWHRDHLLKVPFKEYGTIMRQWKEIGLESGFCRIVERGTPLYNETSPVEPDTTDYDDLILDPN